MQSGLDLGGAEGPVERAQVSTNLAHRLSEEMQKAIVERDRDRAAVLGTKVQAVLVRGVAGNVSTASSRIPARAARVA